MQESRKKLGLTFAALIGIGLAIGGYCSRAGRAEESPFPAKPAATGTPRESAGPLAAILKRLAEEEKRYDPIDVSASSTYRFLNEGEVAGMNNIIRKETTRERSIIAGNRQFHDKNTEYQSGDGANHSSACREACDGQWTRDDVELSDSKSKEHVSTTIALAQQGRILPLAWAHTLLMHDDVINCPSLAAFLASGWYDQDRTPMTVEYLGDERAEGLDCHKLKCSLPIGGKVDTYFLLWLARDRNLLPVRHEWHELRVSKTVPTGVFRVTELREIRPGLWFPFKASDVAYRKEEALREDHLPLQWQRDVQVDKVSLAAPADEKIFSTVDVPEGTLVTVMDGGKSIGKYLQPRTGNIEISLDRFHALERAVGANEDDKYDPKDTTAPKREERIDAAFAVLRADPPRPQKDRIEAALTILQDYGALETNGKKWTTAIRELITIGKPAIPRLIEELDRIDRAARPEPELRALGFVLRGIGDPRAIPALIRALPFALQPFHSDFVRGVDDRGLMAFMQQHDNRQRYDGTSFSLGRPINELLPALQELTGVKRIVPGLAGDDDFQDIFGTFLDGDPPQLRDERKLFLRFAQRWADWWAKNWKQYVSDEKDAQLDQNRTVLERIANQVVAQPGEAKDSKATPKPPAGKPNDPSGKTSDKPSDEATPANGQSATIKRPS